MSEFKFACPVCGQHMMCDTSHGGSVMECPTCFQKIVAPQAPAPDTKFTLTGSKYVEPKIHAGHAGAAHFKTPGGKAMPIWAFILIVVLLAGAASYFLAGTLRASFRAGTGRQAMSARSAQRDRSARPMACSPSSVRARTPGGAEMVSSMSISRSKATAR
jgi:hypothetical protein